MLPSSGEMFVFFRNSMKQCASLSTAEPLYDLYLVFKKYLKCAAPGELRSASSFPSATLTQFSP